MRFYLSRCMIIAAALCMLAIPAHASSLTLYNSTLLGAKSITVQKPSEFKKLMYGNEEIKCMALGLYHEARGEPATGQYAVGVTILNRVRSDAYPNTICGVVFQNEHMRNRCQFSFACDGISDEPKNHTSYKKMQRIAKDLLLNGMSRQARYMGMVFEASMESMTHYHRYDINPGWSGKLEKLSRLGAHVFLKSARVTKRYFR